MNYSEMLDFEINVQVAEVTGKHADYCNSWADAGPIIAENKISLNWYESEGKWTAAGDYEMEDGVWDWEKLPESDASHANPLRAAMIVFLMMQEAANA